MSKRELIHGFQAFTAHMKGSLNRYAQSPILLIQSHALLDGQGRTRESKQISDACLRINFVLRQQLGLRTVPAHSSSDFPFPPTPTAPDAIAQIAQRTGSATLVAVGSGQAMDLAKSVAGRFEHTILVPASYGAALVAGTSHALLLDPTQEMLIPAAAESPNKALTVVTPDVEFAQSETRDNAILAAVSVLLDAMLWAGSNEDVQVYEDLMKNLLDNLQQPSLDRPNHELLCHCLVNTGAFAAYGLGSYDRSVPIALLASLATSTFASSDAMAVLASTVPALHHLLEQRNTGYARAGILQERHLREVPRIVMNEPLEALLARIHENQVAWNCLDARDDVLRTVLQDYVLV